MIYDIIIKGRIEALISIRPVGSNNPPVWNQQPTDITATLGTPQNFDIGAKGSDPDDDALTFSLNEGVVSLATGWNWTAATGIVAYDGTGSVGQTSGHIFTLDDGTDTTDSIPVNVNIAPVVSAISFPRRAIHGIGYRGDSDAFRDPAYQQRLARCNDLTVNLAVADQGHAAQAISDIRAINPNVRICQYSDFSSFLLSSPVQVERRDFVVDNFVTPALPGGAATDGMSRQPDGTVIEAWPNKEDVNQSDFVTPLSSQISCVYSAEQKYNEYYSGAFSNLFDDKYYDIWRHFPRREDGLADWNRDGVMNRDRPGGRYGDFDPTETINASYIRAKEAISAMVQTNSQANRGEDIPILGNIGSWADYYDGARADQDVLLSAPAEMVSITDGGLLENWGKVLGLNPDGTTRASGNFERGYKDAQRLQDFLDVSSATGTKRAWAHFEIQAGLYDEAAYCMGVAMLAGCYHWWARGSDHRNDGELDEDYGQDESALSDAQKVAALNGMGLPIGDPPEHGQAFLAGVNGGIIEQGVYGRHFTSDGTSGGTDMALLYVNPAGNSNRTISAPTGSWKHITGSQRTVNDGSNVVGTLSIDAGESFILEPQ